LLVSNSNNMLLCQKSQKVNWWLFSCDFLKFNVKQQISYFSYVFNNKTLIIPRFGVFSLWGYFSRVFLSFPCFLKIKGIPNILY
jgi:hypothetical protein